MQIRNFTEKDLPVLVRLLNETYGDTYEFIPYTEERLRSWLQEGTLKILIVEENSRFLGSGAYHDGHWGEEYEWLKVLEHPNRKIIEGDLLKELEKNVKGEMVFTSVDAGSPEIAEWLDRGFIVEGGLQHMIASFDRVKPLPTIPEGIILRSLKPDEEKEFVEMMNIGFDRQRLEEGVIQLWKNETPVFNEEWVHVAEANDRIVSAVVSKPDKRYNEFFKGNRGYLGPAATLLEFRGKNLASALTQRAMNFLFEKGMKSVALYTSEQNVASIALLQKLGFTIGHHWKFMRKHFKR